MDIKEKFYEGVKDIVLSEFPWDGKFLEENEYERGLTEDDAIYAILEKAKSKMPDGEYDLRKGIVIGKVIKLATHLYCTDKGIKDISEDIYIRFTYEYKLCVSYIDRESGVKYGTEYHPDILFDIIRFDKNHVDVDAVVPKFIKNGFSYDESKKGYVCYYDDRVVVIYGIPDEK